jgi:hypothetical protein
MNRLFGKGVNRKDEKIGITDVYVFDFYLSYQNVFQGTHKQLQIRFL